MTKRVLSYENLPDDRTAFAMPGFVGIPAVGAVLGLRALCDHGDLAARCARPGGGFRDANDHELRARDRLSGAECWPGSVLIAGLTFLAPLCRPFLGLFWCCRARPRKLAPPSNRRGHRQHWIRGSRRDCARRSVRLTRKRRAHQQRPRSFVLFSVHAGRPRARRLDLGFALRFGGSAREDGLGKPGASRWSSCASGSSCAATDPRKMRA